MRDDEELAKDLFLSHLRSCLKSAIGASSGSDRPDYDLIVDGQASSMEVTTIEARVGDGADVRPARGWVEAIRRWISREETDLQNQGLLNGRYRLRASPVDDFARVEEEMRTRPGSNSSG